MYMLHYAFKHIVDSGSNKEPHIFDMHTDGTEDARSELFFIYMLLSLQQTENGPVHLQT